MAIQIAQDWAAVASGSVDPSGTFTIGSGTNRTTIMVMTVEFGNTFTASAAIGTVAYTGRGEHDFDIGGGERVLTRYWYWDEAAIDSMSGSNVSYSDNRSNVIKRHWSYATFSSADQTTPLTVNSSAASAVTSATPILVATPGESGDHVVLFGAQGGNRNFGFGPGTSEHWDQSDTGGAYRSGLADGAWSSAVSFLGPQAGAFGEDTIGTAIVLNAGVFGASVSGSGAFQDTIATVSGAGEREITGSASFSAALAELAAVGERTITATGSATAQAVTISGSDPVTTNIGVYEQIVKIDDKDINIKTVLHEDPSNHTEQIKDITASSVVIDGGYYYASISLRP